MPSGLRIRCSATAWPSLRACRHMCATPTAMVSGTHQYCLTSSRAFSNLGDEQMPPHSTPLRSATTTTTTAMPEVEEVGLHHRAAAVASPLERLRMPAPVAATDARPYYGSLNTAHAAPGSVHRSTANTNLGYDAHSSARRGMRLDHLLHNHHQTQGGGGGADGCGGSVEGISLRPSAAVVRAMKRISSAATPPRTSPAAETAASEPITPTPPHTSIGNASSSSSSSAQRRVYSEHCIMGWSPEQLYQVVADVSAYSSFLPWCEGSVVHYSRPRQPHTSSDAATGTSSPTTTTSSSSTQEVVDMAATLTIGFAFLKESYTSRVTLVPNMEVVAELYDESNTTTTNNNSADADGGFSFSGLLRRAVTTAAHPSSLIPSSKSVLRHLSCHWAFVPVPGHPQAVEVRFRVALEFRSSLHGTFIMNNIVSMMTRSFERRCERLFGPPSRPRQTLA